MKIKSNLSYTLAALGALGSLPTEAFASFQQYMQHYESAIKSKGANPQGCQVCSVNGSTLCVTDAGFINCLGACQEAPAAATLLKGCVAAFEKNNPSLVIPEGGPNASLNVENGKLRQEIEDLKQQLAANRTIPPTANVTNTTKSPNGNVENEELRKQIAELEKQLESAKAKSSPSASGTGEAVPSNRPSSTSNLDLHSEQVKRYIEEQIASGKLTALDLKPLEHLRDEYNKKLEEYNSITGTDRASMLAKGKLETELGTLGDAIDKQETQLKAAEERKRKEAEKEAKNQAYREAQAKQLSEDKLAYDALAQSFDLLQNNSSALLQKMENVKEADTLNQNIGTYSEQQRKALRYVAQLTIDEGKGSDTIRGRLKTLVASINNSLEVRNVPSATPRQVVLTPEETADKAAYDAIKDNIAEGKIKSWLANDGQEYTTQLKINPGLKTSYIDSQAFEKDITASGADPKKTIQALRYFTSLFLKSKPGEKPRIQAENIKVDLTNLLKKMVEKGYTLKSYSNNSSGAPTPPPAPPSGAPTPPPAPTSGTGKASTAPASSGGFAAKDEIEILGQIQDKAQVNGIQAKKILKLMKDKNLTMDQAIAEFKNNSN